MQTQFSAKALESPQIREADRILRNCVHCGFCNATCPTYQLLGDERDGPRGRIYLIKAALEGGDPEAPPTAETQLHLDRCLTCRNCETTCPSGVEYHKLLDIGRQAVEEQVKRPWREQLLRFGLRQTLVRTGLVKFLVSLGQGLRPLLPGAFKTKLPRQHHKHATAQRDSDAPAPAPAANLNRRMLILDGCVQPALAPNTNAATARVLARLGIEVSAAPEAGCCGAIDYHLNAQQAGKARIRANIDAWWPAIEAGAEAIVQTASGCGAFVKEYGEMLADDPAYADKARQVSRLAKDLVEILAAEDLSPLNLQPNTRVAFHCPCTLQHAQHLGGAVERLLNRLGFQLTPVSNPHLCCGSAGTYSITQPKLAKQLRDNKLDALEAGHPDLIVTANIGCQTHLDGAGRTPVRHWIELVDEAMRTAPPAAHPALEKAA